MNKQFAKNRDRLQVYCDKKGSRELPLIYHTSSQTKCYLSHLTENFDRLWVYRKNKCPSQCYNTVIAYFRMRLWRSEQGGQFSRIVSRRRWKPDGSRPQPLLPTSVSDPKRETTEPRDNMITNRHPCLSGGVLDFRPTIVEYRSIHIKYTFKL